LTCKVILWRTDKEERWRLKFGEKISANERRNGTTLAVTQQQIKSYHYDGQCFANQLTDFEK